MDIRCSNRVSSWCSDFDCSDCPNQCIDEPNPKTRDEVERLKSNWTLDPCWDLEKTEGFKEYQGELKAYSDECKAIWNQRTNERHTQLASKVCPMSLAAGTEVMEHCYVEKCAWWNAEFELCSNAVDAYLKGREVARLER